MMQRGVPAGLFLGDFCRSSSSRLTSRKWPRWLVLHTGERVREGVRYTGKELLQLLRRCISVHTHGKHPRSHAHPTDSSKPSAVKVGSLAVGRYTAALATRASRRRPLQW